MTDQALAYIQRMGEQPWVLHLSYVKPHWPYMAPAPYHARYTPEQCLPVVRNEAEKIDAHPVLAAYRQSEESQSFSLDECIRTVRPAYQGLIEQLDHHLGRLFEALERQGRFKDTLIVFCADHGDFLGDHWLGEKELFYDTVQRVPFIVVDPSPSADATRGTTDERFVEGIDVVPTILDALDMAIPRHRIEGRSLLPLTRGEPVADWRDTTVSELDFAYKAARLRLGLAVDQCQAWSLRTTRWRYVYWQSAPEQLYDLQADPEQFVDLGRSPATEAVRQQFRQQLLAWLAARKRRTTVSHAQIERGTDRHKSAGVFYGQW